MYPTRAVQFTRNR